MLAQPLQLLLGLGIWSIVAVQHRIMLRVFCNTQQFTQLLQVIMIIEAIIHVIVSIRGQSR
jgi:hypothetical protein